MLIPIETSFLTNLELADILRTVVKCCIIEGGGAIFVPYSILKSNLGGIGKICISEDAEHDGLIIHTPNTTPEAIEKARIRARGGRNCYEEILLNDRS